MEMGFTLQLAQDLVEVEAGGNTPVTIAVVNKGDGIDRYELEIEGIDSEWKAIPVPVFATDPGETHAERVFIKPPRTSESLAGNYPFVIRVRSLESGEQKSVQGVVKLKPFHHLTMEINPKKGSVSPTSNHNTFDITVVNLGNTEHTLQMQGSDPEDACTYEFDGEQITVGPGQQKEVSVTVNPVSRPIFASGKLIGFSIAARSIDTPSVASTAQAQLERRSLLSPAGLAVIVLIAIVLAGWILMMPKQPTVAVSVNPMSAVEGDTVNISWAAHDADHVTVSARSPDGKSRNIYDGGSLTDSVPLVVPAQGSEQIIVEVSKGARLGLSVKKVIDVEPAQPKVTPKITSFSSSTKRVKVGGAVTFKWKVLDYEKLALQPTNTEIPSSFEEITVPINNLGDQDFVLVATSKDGVSAQSEPIRITGYDESDAQILDFSASPAKVAAGGSTTLTWNVAGASLIKLLQPSGEAIVVSPIGSQSFPISAKCMFKLTATDSKGRAAIRKVTVDYVPPTITVPPPTTGDPVGSTTGISPSTTTAGETTTGTTTTPTSAGGR